jgi:uncharacterized protein
VGDRALYYPGTVTDLPPSDRSSVLERYTPLSLEERPKEMDNQRIEEIAYSAMAQRRERPTREPGWLYYHGLRTAKIAVHLGRRLETDAELDVVYTGALFHDIGKGAEPHHETGAAITRQLLGDLCTSTELDRICDIVRYHNQRHQASSLPVEIRIVQDADTLDHVGPIDVWLAFYWSGAHRETIHEHMRFIHSEENDRYRRELREGLSFDLSRQIFDERLAYEERFFAEFHRIYLEGM